MAVKKCRRCGKPATVELSVDGRSILLCTEHWEAGVRRLTGGGRGRNGRSKTQGVRR